MQAWKEDSALERGQGRKVSRRSTHGWIRSNSGNLKFRIGSVILLCQIALYASFCHGFTISDEKSGRASFLSTNLNCVKTYTMKSTDSCASIRLQNSITQQQLLLLNPDLNCSHLKDGQLVCVHGVPPNCKKKVNVYDGQSTDGGCENVAAKAQMDMQELLLINPGIICPDVKNRSSLWSSSRMICVSMGPGSIFIEYMGASGQSITFGDIQPIVNASKAVSHIALAFAIEYTIEGRYANGSFSKYWSDGLTQDSARAFKFNNPGVRLLMSVGGDSLWVNDSCTVPVEWFDPPNPDAWIDTAQNTLTSIAELYTVDGIDIDYEHFPGNYSSSNSTFAYCIGTLIQRLKGNNTIGIATIAPFGDVIPPYQDLLAHYGDLIDYISFQFYGYDLPTVAEYVQMYRDVSRMFDPSKLLASTLLSDSNIITGKPFLQAVEQLQDEYGLLGVMLYDADASKSQNFADEIGVLGLLPGPYGSLLDEAPAPVTAPGTRALDHYQWRRHIFSLGFALVMYSLLDL